MKIVYVGELTSDRLAYRRMIALEELGHDVTAHSSLREGMKYYDKFSLLERVFWKTGFPLDSTKVNKAILSSIEQKRPDILWIDKGNTVWPRTLRVAKELSPTTQIVSYLPDDMFASHHRSSFFKWGIRYYDSIFTSNSHNWRANELPSLGAKRVLFVDFAYDPHLHRPVPVSHDDAEAFGANVGFIGSYERERADSMLFLAENGVPVRVWGGGGWHKLLGRHPNLVIENRPLYEDDYAKAICATRINLGFLRKQNRDLQTFRTFEIPACSAFMLAERTDEHLRLFEEGKEAAYFGSNDELLDKVRYYLDHEGERKAIASAGRKRCLDSGYSHHERLKYMLRRITETNDAPR
jgi:spore maturation protein CgeB